MYNVNDNIQPGLTHFRTKGCCFNYDYFVSCLHNWCLDLGFQSGEIRPSRAFCSGESQGLPIILLTKHFGVFPFDHGQGGGVVACDRHSEYAARGQDLVIIQASHVGYDPDSGRFGILRHTAHKHNECTNTCGKISDVLEYYLNEYNFARNHILVDIQDELCYLTIDNQYLLSGRERGLVLNLDKMIRQQGNGKISPFSVKSTASTFLASKQFQKQAKHFFAAGKGPQPIGDALLPAYFSFNANQKAGKDQRIEQNIMGVMPWIVSSEIPMLTAAQVNTQAEFDRVFRSISREPAYRNSNLLYISGLHIDISPPEGQSFVVNKFIPWAAYIQLKSGERYILEQEELCEKFKACRTTNPNQLDFEKVIRAMEDADPVGFPV